MTSTSPGVAPPIPPRVPAETIVVGVGKRLGRDEEFTAFVREHQATLLRTAWLLTGDAHQAEELTQQALVRTYAAWSRAGEGDPLAYTRRILVNLRTDTWRRRRREVLVAPADLSDDATPVGTRRPRGETDRIDDRDRLVRALARLTARQRRIVVLRHLVDLSEAEVAADLGVSLGTVKSTASRAMSQLRTELASWDALAQTPDGRDAP